MTVGIGIRWIVAGMIVGLLVTLAATRFLASQLWQVTPTDPLTLSLVATTIAVAALLASYIPALRATRVDPMVVLRYE
jgi:putative ABC transport system permease protein